MSGCEVGSALVTAPDTRDTAPRLAVDTMDTTSIGVSRRANTPSMTAPNKVNVSTVFDVIVIGGGSAGLAAAVAVAESGPYMVLVLEREEYLGGVLIQCVHDGFGLHLYGESLTGPEFANRWVQRTQADGISTVLGATVLLVTEPDSNDFMYLDVLSAQLGGRITLATRAVVCATGCRERTRGELQVPGGRPAGVLTAGVAQYMVNVKNQLPGDKVVILGSGDIGLIMARRMTLEGAEVRLVLGQEASGLVRNHISCIQDFNIPIAYGWGVARIHGYGQLQGVTVAPLTANGSFDLSRKRYVRCNTLLIACGLVPEREVLSVSGLDLGSPGVFVCGNARKPHDLVDQAVQDALCAGLSAAAYVASLSGKPAPSLSADLKHMVDLVIDEPKGKMSDLRTKGSSDAQCIVCTACPTGCVMKVSPEGVISGHTCARGEEFAQREQVSPMRLFTGAVAVKGGVRPLVAVRTATPVPKDALLAVARACRRFKAKAPVCAGDVLVRDIAHTGVSLVATDSCETGAYGAH